jgi:hypothetical protein
MQELGIKFLYDTNRKDVQTYSTDIGKWIYIMMYVHKTKLTVSSGNILYTCLSLHAIFVIPTEPGQTLHSSRFTLAASITAAHDAALASTKGIGFAGLSILLDDAITSQVQEGELY